MSQPKPAITFRINTETLNRQWHLVPNQREVQGNQTRSEADDQKYRRSVWIPGFLAGENVDRLGHDDTFTMYGKRATYLKTLYCKGTVDDLLTVVETSWD